MTRVIHTGQALVDVVIEVPDLPDRGQNVMATSVTDYAGGLGDGARRGREVRRRVRACGRPRHRPARRPGPARAGRRGHRPERAAGRRAHDTGICVVLIEPSAERTFVTTLGAERQITVESLATSAPEPGDLVCVTGFSLALEQTGVPLLAWLRTLDEGVVVVLDPGSAFAGLSPGVREEMLAHTDVWTSNQEEAVDLLVALDRAPDSHDLAVVTAAIAPLLRGDAVTIVRDGAGRVRGLRRR